MIELNTPSLLIRTPKLSDAKKLASFELNNEKHFAKYASTVMDDVTKEEYWKKKLADFEEEYKKQQSIRFLLFLQGSDELIGVCNFTQIFRGPFQACYLGYRISQALEGKGLMYEALHQAISYMFHTQNIHRIMANYIPTNHRSEKLLLRLGFQKEGYAKEYLFINGKWEDHILTALTNPHWKKD